jgi:putative ABC transport system permease protein
MSFLNTYNLGFNRSSLLVLPSSQTILQNFKSVKQQLEQQPGIVKVSICSRVPSGRLADAQEPRIEMNGKIEPLSIRISDVHVDHDYFNVLGLPMAAGRNFDYALASDSMGGFILNETAVKAIGWKSNEDAIGRLFHYGSVRKGTIIGVVKDFNFESLHEPIKPTVFVVVKNRGRSVIMRIEESKREEVLKYLAEQWSYWRPGFPFSCYTLSDNFDKQYENEQRAGKGVSFFAAFAIFISSLGVFGLALFMAEQRTKEMGIRKALGADTGHITVLLGKWFFILMISAGLVSIPLSYWLATGWLATFAFSSGIGYLPYLIAFAIVTLCTILSVTVQIFRTASQNPVKALRYE